MQVYVVRGISTDGKNVLYDFCFDASRYTMDQVKDLTRADYGHFTKAEGHPFKSFAINGLLFRKPVFRGLFDYDDYINNNLYAPLETLNPNEKAKERRIVLV